MKVAALIAIIFLFLVGCKKDRLKNEKEVFIGKWSWVQSDANLDFCEDYSYDVVMTPGSENTNYTIEFERKGKVYFYQDDIKVGEHRIVFSAFGPPYSCSEPDYTYYSINLDNYQSTGITDLTKILGGCVKFDTLIVNHGFPFYDDDCNLYMNYFVKTD